MTREKLLDLLTTAALIGRNDDRLRETPGIVRGDYTAVVERTMRKQIEEALASEGVATLTPTDLKEVEEALGDAIAYRLGDHDPNLGPSEPDDVEPYRKHKALADRLGLNPWY